MWGIRPRAAWGEGPADSVGQPSPPLWALAAVLFLGPQVLMATGCPLLERGMGGFCSSACFCCSRPRKPERSTGYSSDTWEPVSQGFQPRKSLHTVREIFLGTFKECGGRGWVQEALV